MGNMKYNMLRLLSWFNFTLYPNNLPSVFSV